MEDFLQAITLSSQTALREFIGRLQLAEMIADRDTLGRELQRILDEKTTPWGITVQSVEVRDVRIPQALENAMSQQAQAERERQPASFLVKRKFRFQSNSPRRRVSTKTVPDPCIYAV